MQSLEGIGARFSFQRSRALCRRVQIQHHVFDKASGTATPATKSLASIAVSGFRADAEVICVGCELFAEALRALSHWTSPVRRSRESRRAVSSPSVARFLEAVRFLLILKRIQGSSAADKVCCRGLGPDDRHRRFARTHRSGIGHSTDREARHGVGRRTGELPGRRIRPLRPIPMEGDRSRCCRGGRKRNRIVAGT